MRVTLAGTAEACVVVTLVFSTNDRDRHSLLVDLERSAESGRIENPKHTLQVHPSLSFRHCSNFERRRVFHVVLVEPAVLETLGTDHDRMDIVVDAHARILVVRSVVDGLRKNLHRVLRYHSERSGKCRSSEDL